jgi:hypothetical protein
LRVGGGAEPTAQSHSGKAHAQRATKAGGRLDGVHGLSPAVSFHALWQRIFLRLCAGVSVFTLLSECYSYRKNFTHPSISKHLSATKSAGLHDKFISRRTDGAHS